MKITRRRRHRFHYRATTSRYTAQAARAGRSVARRSPACARSEFRTGLYPLAAVRCIVAERLAGPAVFLFAEFAGGFGRSGTGSHRRARARELTVRELALALLTRSKKYSGIRVWGLGIAKRRGLRRAAVAVARKLAVLMRRIWADGTEYRWQREAAVEA